MPKKKVMANSHARKTNTFNNNGSNILFWLCHITYITYILSQLLNRGFLIFFSVLYYRPLVCASCPVALQIIEICLAVVFCIGGIATDSRSHIGMATTDAQYTNIRKINWKINPKQHRNTHVRISNTKCLSCDTYIKERAGWQKQNPTK